VRQQRERARAAPRARGAAQGAHPPDDQRDRCDDHLDVADGEWDAIGQRDEGLVQRCEEAVGVLVLDPVARQGRGGGEQRQRYRQPVEHERARHGNR